MGNPGLGKVGYDAIKDFEPISLTSRIPALLVVPTDSPAKSVGDLIAMAKAQTSSNFDQIQVKATKFRIRKVNLTAFFRGICSMNASFLAHQPGERSVTPGGP